MGALRKAIGFKALRKAYNRSEGRTWQASKRHTHKRRLAKMSLTVRKLGGMPDSIQVKLPYTFTYNVVANPLGLGAQPGTVLTAFSGNCYPNIAGYDLRDNPAGYTTIETPTNFYQYASRYGKCFVSGSKLDMSVSFNGVFSADPSTGTPIIDLVGFESPTIVCIAAPYDKGDEEDPASAENTGTFHWNGRTSMQPVPNPTTDGNWQTIENANLEEVMSMPNASIKLLGNAFSGKTVARFKQYRNVKEFVNVKDIKDNDDLSFTPPEGALASLANSGQDLTPQRGFGWMVKAYVPFLSQGGNSAMIFQCTGRITYYYTFMGLRPISQVDWTPQ